MDGMGMLLKAAGFDPAQFQQFVQGMQAYMQKVNADLETLKSNQEKLIAQVSRIADGLDPMGAPIEESKHG